MSKSADEEKSRWDQVMENFDLLFSQMNEMGVVQQQLKTHVAQQVKANGQAISQLTLRRFKHEEKVEDDSDSASEVFEEDTSFPNVFADNKGKSKPEPSKPDPSKGKRFSKTTGEKSTLPRQSIPKMQFPTFDGTDPRYGRITIRVTLTSTVYLRTCGSQQQLCI